MSKSGKGKSTTKSALKKVEFPRLANIEETTHRGFFIRGYVEPEKLSDIFQAYEKWSYIYHDKDSKAPHYHYAMYSPKYQTSLQAIAKKLVSIAPDQGWYISPLGKAKSAHEYMLHVDKASRAKGKHVYSVDELQTNNQEWARVGHLVKQVEASEKPDFVEAVLSGEYTHVEMARTFGPAYIFNCKKVREFRDMAQCQASSLEKMQSLANEVNYKMTVLTARITREVMEAVEDTIVLLPEQKQYLAYDIKELVAVAVHEQFHMYQQSPNGYINPDGDIDLYAYGEQK